MNFGVEPNGASRGRRWHEDRRWCTVKRPGPRRTEERRVAAHRLVRWATSRGCRLCQPGTEYRLWTDLGGHDVTIAFVGDVHGCVLHLLDVLARWQLHHAQTLDAVILVGDVGAFRTPEAASREPGWHYTDENPAQLDWFRLLEPDDGLRRSLRRARAALPAPLLFISGNHEEHAWLEGLHQGSAVVTVDPEGLLAHVEDGSITVVEGLRVAALGRIEWPAPVAFSLDEQAYAGLWDLGPGAVDILVTHDGPIGSPRIRALIDRLEPVLHVSGHYHHADGPRRYGVTVSWQLDQLVAAKTNRRRPWKDNPHQVVRPCALGVFDADAGFSYVTGEWLAETRGDRIDLDAVLPSGQE